MDSLVPVVVVIVLVLLNGFFVAAEFAIVGAPRAAIERRAARGDRVAALVKSIVDDPRRQDRFIATAQLGITAASLGLGMYGEHVLAERIAGWLASFGGARWIAAHAIASVIAVTLLAYVHIVIGEMVPKSLALQHAERTLLWIARPMIWTKTLCYPLIVTLNGLGNAILKLLGVNRQAPTAERYHTAEELQLVVQESAEGGALRAESGRVLRELFEFGELTAGQVMVPRVRISGIPLGASAADLRALVTRAPHTRFPVYEGDLDHIIGMVHIKDVMRRVMADESVQTAHARPLPMVPETVRLDTVLETMQRHRAQMAVVIDEHGGTAGLVTLEDLFEEVVGEIEEGILGTPQIYADRLGRLRVTGTMRLDEVGQRFELELEHKDVDSVSGLVLTLLGRPARLGDVVTYDRLRFEVTTVEGHGVRECAVTRLAPVEPEGTGQKPIP